MKSNLFAILFYAILPGVLASCSARQAGFAHFITASGNKLMDGQDEYRFISYNIPNLHYVEDNMAFEQTIPFRFPDEFEIRDALLSVKQMGGRVVRIYTLSVRRQENPKEMPRHVLGPGQFNEDAFIALDKCLQLANQLGIRLIIPFVDNWIWWGGRGEYAAFRNKEADEFWTDPQIFADFKETINFVVNRTNIFTGITYKNDKAILCWETGNELTGPASWTADIAAYIKSLDPNHLVLDGFHSSVLRDESLADPNIDLVTTHHYQKDPQQIVNLIKANVEKARNKKPYFVGEFGFIPTDGVKKVLDTVIESSCSGALLWSLRVHNRDGGFYWHSEPYGGNLFKAYHWPGFSSGDAFDETNCVQLMRDKAFEIRGLKPPPIHPPEAPTLLPIEDVSAISWQGSAGASGYTIERTESPDGEWSVVAENVSDADVQYRPLYNDRTAERNHTYSYRIIAVNESGASPPSNTVAAPAVAYHTLVDECRDWEQTYRTKGELLIKYDEARKTKEDAHRFLGQGGDVVFYQCEENIRAFRFYTFFPDKVTDFKISGSSDGNTYTALDVKRTEYYSGEGEYDYDKPVLFSAESIPADILYLKITFPGKAQISRIEIKYGS